MADILVKLANGKTLKFPEGTDDAVIDRVAKQESFQTDQSVGGYVDNLGRSIARGASFGFADEISAAGDATAGQFMRDIGLTSPEKGQVSDAPSWSERYKQNLDYQRTRDKAFTESNPVSSIAGQVVGGVAGAIPFIAASGPATLGAATLQSAKVGSGAGALAGFGEGEGGFGNRVENAGVGAAIGGAVGAAIPGAAKGVSSAWRTARRAFDPTQADDIANNAVRRALERDGITPEQLGARMGEFAATGRPVMPIDVAGENTAWLAKAATATPGPGRQAAQTALAERQAGQSGRIASVVDDASGARGGGYYENLDAQMRQRAADARPLYEKAFAQQGAGADARVQQFLADPIAKEGMKRGLNVQRLEALAEGKPFNPVDYAITGFNEAGDPIIGGVPTMRLLDAVKRGIDEILEGYRDKVTGRLVLDETGRAIEGVRRVYVQHLDKLNPDYAAARQAWAGPSQSMDAMALGRAALTKDSEVTARTVAQMSPSQQEFYREGVRRALRDTISRTQDGADVVKRLWGNPQIRERIQAALPPEEFARFSTIMGQEGQMFRQAQAASANKGAQTTPLAEAISDFRGGDALSPAQTALSGQPLRALYAAALQGAKRHMEGVNDRTSAQLARGLTATGQSERDALVRALIAQRARQQALSQQRYGRSTLAVPGLVEGIE